MTYKPLHEIDGRFLYYAFIAGGIKILEHQAEINAINVFPVNDKDTGSNLASTIRSVSDIIRPDRSYKITVGCIAEAALIGARGNSGVIFAQFLYGVSQETASKNVITLSEFADSIQRSIPYIYNAISNPVEGTMLTVIKEWSDFISHRKHEIKDFGKIFIESLEVLKKSLNETTTKLKILNHTNLVDAGAKGFVLFVEGIIEFINGKHIRNFAVQPNEDILLVHSESIEDEEIKFRYCSEAILKNLKIPTSDLREILEESGDSVVIAGSNTLCRIHLHTNNPAELFFKLKDDCTISFQKVDDMVRQQDASLRRKWNIALVTDSSCDLPPELLDKYQIHVVPLNLNFGENHYLDKVTIQPKQFYELLQNSPHFPKTSQINEKSFTNVFSQLASNYDAIISINLSGQFSGTYSSSLKAAKRITKEFNKPVFVIDSKNLSGALGLLVLRTAQSIEDGWPFEKIIESLDQWVKQTKIFVSVSTMKYLVRSGRVSKPKGYIASLLGINPIVSVNEHGQSILFGKAFSQKANIIKVMNHLKKISEGKKIWNYIVLHANNVEGADIYSDKMFRLTGKEPLSVLDISPAIGMHAGTGSLAISFMFE